MRYTTVCRCKFLRCARAEQGSCGSSRLCRFRLIRLVACSAFFNRKGSGNAVTVCLSQPVKCSEVFQPRHGLEKWLQRNPGRVLNTQGQHAMKSFVERKIGRQTQPHGILPRQLAAGVQFSICCTDCENAQEWCNNKSRTALDCTRYPSPVDI